MKRKTLLEDDDAVSPVIGVILMVAITVILAAVIGTFVLDLGNQTGTSAPTASFSFDTVAGNSDAVEIIHDGGDSIPKDELSADCDGDSLSEGWSNDPVNAGTTAECDMSSGGTIQVIWESQDGSNSQILAEYETN